MQGQPKVYEQTFNIGLAQAIRRRKPSWSTKDVDVVQDERLQALAGSTGRPDILIRDPLSPPLVIEVSHSGRDAELDARKRLGQELSSDSLRIHAAIAIVIPQQFGIPRSAREVTQTLLRGFPLQYAFLHGESGAQARRWPTTDFVRGNLDDLVAIFPAVRQSNEQIAKLSEFVARMVRSCAVRIERRTPKDDQVKIARSVRQKMPWHGLTTASVLWLNALLSQNRVHKTHPREIPQAAACLSIQGYPLPQSFIDAWRAVLKINYRSVFVPALDSLVRANAASIEGTSEGLECLLRAVEQIQSARLGSYIDLGAELFPRLSDDRKTSAAFYTRPATAELLACLTIRNKAADELGVAWGTADLGRRIRIADTACGTGTLVRAGYRQIRNLHERHCGDTGKLHRDFMEHGVVAVDISAIAAHLTATSLSAMEPGEPYGDVQIGCVPIGAPDRTGSLEFLEHDEVGDLFQDSFEASPGRSLQQRVTSASLPSLSLHYFLANPPYSRTRGGQSLFGLAGLSDRERKAAQERAKRLGRGTCASLSAGLPTFFVAKADRKLRVGGRMGFVLPLTAASAPSYRQTRQLIETRYTSIVALTVAGGTLGDESLSSDTTMNEMLLVAEKGPADQVRPSPVTCVNLIAGITEIGPARETARAVLESIDTNVQTDRGEVRVGGQRLAVWIRRRNTGNGAPWSELGAVRDDIAAAAELLAQGILADLRSDRQFPLPLPFVALDALFEVGPTHHRIGHVHGNDPIGAFEFQPLDEANPVLRDTALWAANSKTQGALVVEPTHRGLDPQNPDRKLQESMRQQRGTLFYARNHRWTSQALVAATTRHEAFGGRAWTALRHDDERVRKAFALWANSILGLAVHWTQGGKQQLGRSLVQVNAIGKIPVPKLDDLPAERLAGAAADFDELARCKLLPTCQAHADNVRIRIDEAVLRLFGLSKLEMAQTPPGAPHAHAVARQTVAGLREGFCREPQVHGYNSRATALLRERSQDHSS